MAIESVPSCKSQVTSKESKMSPYFVRLAIHNVFLVTCYLPLATALKRFRFFDRLVNRADHVERLLRQAVVLAVNDAAEGSDGVLQGHVLARGAGEHLGDEERLRQELLDLARPRYGELVLFGQLVHAEDGDDVLQLLVALQRRLHVARGAVVLFADHVRVHLAAGGVERIHRRVDAELGHLAREHHGRIQVRARGRGRGVGEIVGRYVDSLYGRDRAGLGRGDAFLQNAHLVGERRLVAHGRGHAPEQRRDLGAGERVAVDVVYEQQHVATLVAEVLGDGEAGEAHAQAVARRLVHLAVDERHFVEHAAFLHLVVEVVALARALADTGKHRVARVLHRDVADELHHVHGLAHAGAAEQADLAALGERADEVDDLDAGLEQFGRSRLLLVRGRLAVDRHGLFGPDRSLLVDRPPQHVHDAPEGLDTDRYRDRRAGVGHGEAALQPVGRTHGDGAHDAVAALLLHLERQIAVHERQR